MFTESMMCPSLYSDIASVTFGLYENKDERMPYSLFVVSIDEEKIIVFSSEKHIDLTHETEHFREWIKKHPDIKDVSRRPILRFEPYIASYDMSAATQMYDQAFFEGMLNITHMDMVDCWPVCTNRVYLVLYKDSALTLDHLPELMMSACETANIAWRTYFDKELHNAAPPPRIDVKDIIESLENFKDVAPFFETVTKISSLFYEKSRSKGSIAVMKKIQNTLVRFKTDANSETLPFSIEHAKQLRKLLETTKYGLSLLVWDDKVYGIGVPSPTQKLYTFVITGQMEWHVLDRKDIQILRYKHGDYYLPEEAAIRSWHILGKIEDDDVRNTVDYVLQDKHMKAFERGALLIITDQAESEVERLCEQKRGLHTEQISLDQFDKTSALCAIDGALFLDKDGDCYGIGIIVDGEAKIKGTPARGSRYNSAKTYISRCVDKKIVAYALVVSSDGYIDIITSNDNEFKPIIEAKSMEDV